MFSHIKELFTRPSGYQISRSVRFRSSATAYFNRTFSAEPSTYTLSTWVKRGALGATGTIAASRNAAVHASFLAFDTSDRLYCYLNDVAMFTTTAVFRDPAAWYHVVLKVTQSGAVVCYVNNQQVGSGTVGSSSYLFTNASGFVNTIGRYGDSSTNYFDGYLTEVNFIDGQALTPSSFGETNSVTGVWQPKKYAGTYGTNGFYLNFSDNSNNTAATIGKDYSGNGNNWTPNNISVTAGATYDSMLDTPTPYADGGNGRGNYAVFNAVAKASSQPTFSNGNLDLSASSAWNGAVGTIGVTSGKWYWEVVNGNGDAFVGICGDNLVLTSADPQTLTGTILYYGGNGNKRIDGTLTSYGATYTTETIGVALDVDGGTITFYKNNTSQGSISLSSSTLNGKTIFPFFVKYASTSAVNFGQRPFSYTPPTGFVALNTQNLPTPTISNGANYMAASLWTGDASTPRAVVSNLSFSPDLVWTKDRSVGYQHSLQDTVRGTGASKKLYSSLTEAENGANSVYGHINSFDSNGFTVATGSSGAQHVNASGVTYVGWSWKAGGTAVSNTSGSITSTVSAGATQGFSVVTFTGTGSAATVGHGLGVAPKMIIVKQRGGGGTSGVNDWVVSHASLTSGTYFIRLNTTAAQQNSATVFSAFPSSTVINIGNDSYVNASSGTYVAYCFAEVAGYSKFGLYTGNGSADGPFVYLGFRPRFVLIKRTDTAGNSWLIYDSSRVVYNADDLVLYPNLSNAEDSGVPIDILSNGFKQRTSWTNGNASGGTYIFAAFAENPYKLSLAR